MPRFHHTQNKGDFIGSRDAFTLVELLVVIGIISALVAILLPALKRARDHAMRVECASNMHQIGILMAAYAADNKGLLPGLNADMTYWGSLIGNSAFCGNWHGPGKLYEAGYTKTHKIFLCRAEVEWQGGDDGLNYWSSVYQNQHEKGWTTAYGRCNMSYIYRANEWSNGTGHASIDPGPFPWNFNNDDYTGALKKRGISNYGFLCENVISVGRSPANATGTAHRGGGNALYYDFHVSFLNDLNNPYNPGVGPFGYDLGFWLFRDLIDFQ